VLPGNDVLDMKRGKRHSGLRKTAVLTVSGRSVPDQFAALGVHQRPACFANTAPALA